MSWEKPSRWHLEQRQLEKQIFLLEEEKRNLNEQAKAPLRTGGTGRHLKARWKKIDKELKTKIKRWQTITGKTWGDQEAKELSR